MRSDKAAGAPERIWVQWPNPDSCGLAFTVPANPGLVDKGKATQRTSYILATPEAIAASPEVQALMQPDADLLLDAYKALLVLRRVLDKAGLTLGAETAENIAGRIVAAHPEIPARSAIRAEAAAILEEPK